MGILKPREILIKLYYFTRFSSFTENEKTTENSQEHETNNVIYMSAMQLNKIKSSIKNSSLLFHIKIVRKLRKSFS